MTRFETIIVLSLVLCAFTTGSFGGRITRDASPESSESNESNEKKDTLDVMWEALKKHTSEVQKQLKALAENGHETTKQLATDASNHLDQGLSDIQANIAKIKADPAAVGEKLLDLTSKRAMEIATTLSKTVEDMKKQGATLASNVIDKAVENSKKLSEAAEKAMSEAGDKPAEPAVAA
ncbi:hypothetical protein ACFFRR_003936 [Megaselia abdita]